MTNNCTAIAPGKPVKAWQQWGLDLAARLNGGRDVVLAIDLTESVGLNAEGRLRLTQIIEDSLQSGDTVYLMPFATEVNPLQPGVDPLALSAGIEFKPRPEVIEQILDVLPFESAINLSNTDIQQAELFTYRGLARLNQCRLDDNVAPKPQSVIWLTDAPLLTEAGIDSATWIETPAKSPFRRADSQASQDRQAWLQALPIEERSQTITTDNNRTYELTVVDLPPTVQEFCTPAPGSKETCLVTPYLFKLLLFPTLIGFIVLGVGAFGAKYLISLNKKWRVKVRYISNEDLEAKSCSLKHKQKIAIGGQGSNAIFCPGEDIRGYLIRKGNKMYLKPTRSAPLLYRDRQLDQEIEITRDRLTINCPFVEQGKNQDFEIDLKVFR
ncbi:MAG: VWA domain-containing protein [Cyanobacteria bacterium J06643_13]